MLVVTEGERKPEESYLWCYSIPLCLLGKNRPLTRTCPQEEAPPWPPGAGSAAHPVDTKWFWTDTGSMGFRGTCWWKTSSTSTSRSPPGMVRLCIRHARRLFLLFVLVGHSTECLFANHELIVLWGNVFPSQSFPAGVTVPLGRRGGN